MTEEKTEEECVECKLSIGIGLATTICKEMTSGLDCEDIREKVLSGDITIEEAFAMIRAPIKGTQEYDTLGYILEDIQEAVRKHGLIVDE